MRQLCGVGLVVLAVFAPGCRKISDPTKLKSGSDYQLPAPGLYAKRSVLGTHSSANGIQTNGKTERILLVRLERNGQTIEVKGRTCGLSSVNTNGTELTFPQSFAQYLPEFTSTFNIATTDGKVVLNSVAMVETLGAALIDPEKEALPKAASDPRVRDQDRDGQPGMSVNIRVKVGPFSAGGKVFIVQKIKWSETSTRVGADSFEGTTQASIDQETIGSDSQIFAAVKPKVVSNNSVSAFAFKKVPEGSTCETLMRDARALFGEFKI